MPRRAVSFTQGDVVRLLKAAKSAGIEVARVELKPDCIVLLTPKDTQPEQTSYDTWKATHARPS